MQWFHCALYFYSFKTQSDPSPYLLSLNSFFFWLIRRVLCGCMGVRVIIDSRKNTPNTSNGRREPMGLTICSIAIDINTWHSRTLALLHYSAWNFSFANRNDAWHLSTAPIAPDVAISASAERTTLLSIIISFIRSICCFHDLAPDSQDLPSKPATTYVILWSDSLLWSNHEGIAQHRNESHHLFC